MESDKIKIIKNFINQEDAQKIINYINEGTNTAVDWLSDGSTPNFVYRPKRFYKRRMGLDDLQPEYSPERSISNLREIEGLIKNIIKNLKLEINKAFSDQDKLYINSLWLAKHLKNDWLSLHSDRKGYNSWFHYSSVLYLNTVKSGGELYFPSLNLYIKPNIGDLVVFLSDGEEMTHEIKMTSEERYTVAMWFTKNPAKEVKFV
jgi:hypothetical protein